MTSTPREYKLTVRTEGMPDVKSTFTVVRNAPGLFVNMVDTTPHMRWLFTRTAHP